MATTCQPKPFRGRAYFYKKDAYGEGWKRRFFKLDHWTIRYYKNQDSSSPNGCIDLSKGRGVRLREHCKVQWPPEANPHLCFGIATESRTYYLYATDMHSIQPWITELHKIIIEKVGKVCTDWQNDIEGKPESDESKTARGVVQIASMFAKGVAESGVLSDKSSLALKSLATVAEGQAAADVHTSWKDRAKLGVIDGLKGLKKDEPNPYQFEQGSMNPMDGLLMYQSPMNSLLAANSQFAGLAAGANNMQMSLTYPGNGQALANSATGYPLQYPSGPYHSLNSSWQQINALWEDLVPLYRYWKSSKADHFYTTNIEEIGTATPQAEGRFGYKSECIQCLIYSKPKTGTVPLYRYWSGGQVIDHFYTTNAGEIGPTIKGQVGAYGFVSEGIAGYCFPNAVPGTIPLYRYYSAQAKDHFYTTNAQEIGTIIAGETGHYGYRSEGIVCYVFPYSG